MFWHATYEVARKEFLQLLRTKRLLSIGIIIALVMVLITIVVPAAIGASFLGGDQGLPLANILLALFLENPLFIFSGFFLLQLLALLLTGDAVASEWQDRTLFLLLSKPVPRAAFVLGKLLGVTVSVGAFTAALMGLDYLVLIAAHGLPEPTSVGRFFVAVALVVLGMAAYAAAALLFSSLVRSPIAGLLLAIVAWVVVFPLLGQLELLVNLIRFGLEGATANTTGWSEYLTPGPSMRVAADALQAAPGQAIRDDVVKAMAVLVGHIAVWSGLAVAVVQRRDFE